MIMMILGFMSMALCILKIPLLLLIRSYLLWFIIEWKAETYGFEVMASWQATERWKLIAGYSYLDIQLHEESLNNDS